VQTQNNHRVDTWIHGMLAWLTPTKSLDDLREAVDVTKQAAAEVRQIGERFTKCCCDLEEAHTSAAVRSIAGKLR
jgi:hypothetical protein